MVISKIKKGYSGHRPDVVSLVPEHAINILDVGCGAGGLARAIKDKNLSAKVYGVDANEALLGAAEKHMDGLWLADLNSEDWWESLGELTFDVIIFADVLEHLISPGDVLRLSLTKLADNGIVITCLPNVRHWSTFYYLYCRGIWPQNERGIFDKTHLHFFTRRNILTLLNNSDLKIDKEKRNVRIVEPWSWTNIPGKFFDFWPLRGFFTFQYLHVSRRSKTDIGCS